jgi:hypothetical protein
LIKYHIAVTVSVVGLALVAAAGIFVFLRSKTLKRNSLFVRHSTEQKKYNYVA